METTVNLIEAAPAMPRDAVIMSGNGTENVCASGHAGRPCSAEWFFRGFHGCALSPPIRSWAEVRPDQEGDDVAFGAGRIMNGGRKRVKLV